jgi:DNA polymerase alpha subunit B
MPGGGKKMAGFPDTQDFPFGSLCLEKIEVAGDRKVKKNSSDRRVHLVSNPSTIKINDMTIGMTSTDTLLQLASEEINQKLIPGTRIPRLAEHCIQQQSYYPLFPTPPSGGMNVNLDVNERSGYSMPVQPDILLIPSRLTCLAKDVTCGTVVVNPGHLVKGASGGSFAVMDIHPKTMARLNDNKEVEEGLKIKDRIRVEIRKI